MQKYNIQTKKNKQKYDVHACMYRYRRHCTTPSMLNYDHSNIYLTHQDNYEMLLY